MNKGYIRVYRSLIKKGYYNDSHYIHLWVHLLMCATYQPKEYLHLGKIQHLEPGQFITGRLKLATDTGIQESKVERILTTFKNEQQIEQQSFGRFRIITICNWDKYQNNEQVNEQLVNSSRTAREQLVNTINKEKKEKKEINKVVALPEWIDPSLWKDFCDHRKKLRKPMTKRAEEILIKKLESLKDEGHNPRHLIITAIERGWQSVFAPTP